MLLSQSWELQRIVGGDSCHYHILRTSWKSLNFAQIPVTGCLTFQLLINETMPTPQSQVYVFHFTSPWMRRPRPELSQLIINLKKRLSWLYGLEPSVISHFLYKLTRNARRWESVCLFVGPKRSPFLFKIFPPWAHIKILRISQSVTLRNKMKNNWIQYNS